MANTIISEDIFVTKFMSIEEVKDFLLVNHDKHDNIINGIIDSVELQASRQIGILIPSGFIDVTFIGRYRIPFINYKLTDHQDVKLNLSGHCIYSNLNAKVNTRIFYPDQENLNYSVRECIKPFLLKHVRAVYQDRPSSEVNELINCYGTVFQVRKARL